MYVYALLNAPTQALELPHGIDGPLSLVCVDRLAALVEPLSPECLPQDGERLLEAVLAHDRVLRHLFQQTSILPLPFLRTFFSESGLQEQLAIQQQHYLDALAQLEGKAEYQLTLTPLERSEPTFPATLTGKDYFLAKKQHYQAQQLQQIQQQQELEAVMRLLQQFPARFSIEQGQASVEHIYLLVDKNEERLHQHLQAAQLKCEHWQLTIGEALPPFHFVG